jgi:nicotinamidase-related amidase
MRRSATALLVSGLQNDYFDAKGALAATGSDISAVQAIVPAVERVLGAARDADCLIVHVQERTLEGGMSDSPAWRAQYELNGWQDTFAAEGTWGEEALDGFAPQDDELVVERYRPGAIYDTRASVLLRSAGVGRVVVVGAETHRTILATAIQAACLDYEVVVPEGAVASADPARHAAAITVLGSWAHVVDVDGAVERLARLPRPMHRTLEG